ncbi:tyrosine-protein phosphatase [Gordonia sp. (in: high G+C Gram-positive bacteria)]|uniref:tyrosine-protein phosphatase n=1 Tax=unclassified Gordonia (in: high G+C Gram-positive bacteria) TaxID=2657482 RepID=UPI002618F807|nr:tyrosine-protein phosphatase [Gordonia sp. (in: high G+C Gram-positive bacteria)]
MTHTARTRTRLRSSHRIAAVALSGALLAPLAPIAFAPHAAAQPSATLAASWTTVTLPNKVIVPGREIGLAGTDNTRLLAGYRGLGGKVVNNLVLRSDNLSKLTPSDQRRLAARKVGVVVDLRTGIERQIQPDRPVPGARWMSADVLGGVPPLALIDLPQAYSAFVNDAQARREIRDTLIAIKNTTAQGRTALFHCTAGKDRTGWVAVTLLTILGVDRATINADYLASNHYRHARANDPLNGVNMGLLNTSYSAVKARYGTFDRYLKVGLKLSDTDLAALRRQLLV